MPRPSRPWLWTIAFGALYLAFAARTPQWADASKLTLYAMAGYLPSWNPGDHPGWTAVAWAWCRLVPLPPSLACHLLASLAAASSVGLLVALGQRRGWPTSAVRGAALVWGLAHAPWWAAEATETYSLAFALTLASLLAQTAGKRLLAGLAAGWGAATHALSVFLTLPEALRRPRASWLAGFVLGSCPVWLAAFATPADPLTGQVSAGTFSLAWHWQSFLSVPRMGKGAALLAALLAYNLGPVGGLAWAKAPWRQEFPAWTLLPLAFFLASYAPFRLHLMVGFLLLGALLAKPPALSLSGAAVHGLLQPAVYFLLPTLLTAFGAATLGVRQLPGRNNASYFLCPAKAWERSAATYAQELLSKAPRGAVILADFNPGAVLRLVQVERALRPDVRIEPTVVDNCLAHGNPAGCLAAAMGQAKGRPVLLADTYEPYYRLGQLAAMGVRSVGCGPGVLVLGNGESEPSN
jgi:hypothetical protein